MATPSCTRRSDPGIGYSPPWSLLTGSLVCRICRYIHGGQPPEPAAVHFTIGDGMLSALSTHSSTMRGVAETQVCLSTGETQFPVPSCPGTWVYVAHAIDHGFTCTSHRTQVKLRTAHVKTTLHCTTHRSQVKLPKLHGNICHDRLHCEFTH
jgi:hypothetical protein